MNSTPNKNLNTTYIIAFLTLLVMFAAFYAGVLYTENKNLKAGNLPSRSGNALVDNSGSPDLEPADIELDPPSEGDHVRGNSQAKIALIEYSDFSCPFCISFHSTAIQVIEDYGDQIMWVYRHYPLYSIHPDAEMQAIASECISDQKGQDGFWAFADKVLGDQDPKGEAVVKQIATELGVNMTQFNECLTDPETKAKVDSDVEAGNRAGVTGTPGNFIMDIDSGEIVPLKGAVPYAQVKQAIDSMIK